MKTVRDIIRKRPVWVNPEHNAETAIILLRGYSVAGLPVLDHHKLVGMIFYDALLTAAPGSPVSDLMIRDVPVLTLDMPIRRASHLLIESGLDRLPVFQEDRLAGMITAVDLLPEVSRAIDPLTGLPWADTLRQWAIDQLKTGIEITILFIDLDRFGQFNKRFGHTVGDAVLRSVSGAIQGCTQHDLDLVCRYGGDEFGVVTLRPLPEAEDLGVQITQAVGEIQVEGIEGERITCTVGRAGGKRTKERERVHYAATVENLISLSSRDCLANKIPERGKDGAGSAPRLRLSRVDVTWSGLTATVSVSLLSPPAEGSEESRQTSWERVMSAASNEESILRLVADTTVAALDDYLPDGYAISVTDVMISGTGDGRSILTVAAQYTTPTNGMAVAGSAIVSTDRYRAAAAAVLDAVNRVIGRIAD